MTESFQMISVKFLLMEGQAKQQLLQSMHILDGRNLIKLALDQN